MFKFKNKRAFTLIELLVVIAIIGILVTIAVIALNSARSKARDAKRVANIKQVQTALELFFNDKNRYPTLSEYNSGALYSTSSFNGTTTYMEIVPDAPTPPDGNCTNNQNQFSYTPTNNGGSYTISYCLGNPTGSIAEGPHCATPSTIAGGACDGSGGSTGGCTQDSDCTGDNICVSNVCTSQIIYGTNTFINYSCNPGNDDTCTYNVVKIGTQYWLKENINIGVKVDSLTENDDQASANTGTIQKYCYGNNSANCVTDGGLYQWHTALGLHVKCDGTNFSSTGGTYPFSADCDGDGSSEAVITIRHQGICPDGWHVPSDSDYGVVSDFRALEQGLSTTINCNSGSDACLPAGDKLKKSLNNPFVGNDGCLNPIDGICGVSRFDALLSGHRAFSFFGGFVQRGEYGYLVSSLPLGQSEFFGRDFGHNYANFDRNYYPRASGHSVRCLKD